MNHPRTSPLTLLVLRNATAGHANLYSDEYMARTLGTESILSVANQWKTRCLEVDGSVLSGEQLWTSNHFDELQRYFVDNLDMGEGTFMTKLQTQLAPASAGAKRLAAELMWAILLFPNNMTAAAKGVQVREIWSWSGSELPANHPLLEPAFSDGIGSGGQAIHTRRWAELAFAIRLFRRWKSLEPSARDIALADPWKFGQFVDQTPESDRRQFRHMVLHLLFPDTFERFASRGHRASADEAFSELISGSPPAGDLGESPTLALDRRLLQIRRVLSKEVGNEHFDFYDAPLASRWHPDKAELRPNIELVLADYAQARASSPFGKSHPINGTFDRIRKALARSSAVSDRPTLKVEASVGKGNWAKVPWIAFLDSRETSTTRMGVYCVLLFRQDMSGVYLTFNQGVTEPQERLGVRAAREYVRGRAGELREIALDLTEYGFSLDDQIDLKADRGLGSDYEDSTIAYKFYPAGAIPADARLLADLEAALTVYDRYLDKVDPKPASRAWIFQANPKMFDLRRALSTRSEMSWLVRRYSDEVRPGDKVYLWESGPNAGILAVAEVASSPIVADLAAQDLEYVHSEEKLEGPQLRSSLRISKVLPTPLSRAAVLDAPALGRLSIIRMPTGTNFPVTSEEAATIDELISSLSEPTKLRTSSLDVAHRRFADALHKSGVSFGERHDDVTRTLMASLATKRFVILTGLSGSGKTQLALRFGEWCGEDQFLIVPVRPDWTGSDALFGYEDALSEVIEGRRAWHVPAALEFMLRAAQDPSKPYVLVLDEMNLAHVERYFADVLSGIESSQPCLPNLVCDGGRWYARQDDKPLIAVPANLFVVGTVNVDETTYLFSPKVLDRANTIEFRVGTDELNPNLRTPVAMESGAAEDVRAFLLVARDQNFQFDNHGEFAAKIAPPLKVLHSVLSVSGGEFGHRVFFESLRYSAVFRACGGTHWQDALDFQLLQKVLPRIHGSRRKLEPILAALTQFCLDPESSLALMNAPVDPLNGDLQAAVLPRSFEKVRRMTRSVRANQFASFAE